MVVNGHKIPHHIHMRDNSVFAFAGLWDRWEGEDESIESCTIIVMPSNEVMKPIHERMPAIIAPAHYDLWLDSRVTDKQEIMQSLTSAPSSQLTAYPVSTRVNSPKNNDEQCIRPAV
jgi:putative SOS response-associated peptidase YedK